MAYSASTLFCVSGPTGDAPRLWTYKTADTIATVNTAGYFNNASDVLNVGDIIFVASASSVMTITYVASNASGVVDVVDGLTITATDSD